MNDTKRTTTCVASTPVEVFVIGKSVSYVAHKLSTPFLHRVIDSILTLLSCKINFDNDMLYT